MLGTVVWCLVLGTVVWCLVIGTVVWCLVPGTVAPCTVKRANVGTGKCHLPPLVHSFPSVQATLISRTVTEQTKRHILIFFYSDR